MSTRRTVSHPLDSSPQDRHFVSAQGVPFQMATGSLFILPLPERTSRGRVGVRLGAGERVASLGGGGLGAGSGVVPLGGVQEGALVGASRGSTRCRICGLLRSVPLGAFVRASFSAREMFENPRSADAGLRSGVRRRPEHRCSVSVEYVLNLDVGFPPPPANNPLEVERGANQVFVDFEPLGRQRAKLVDGQSAVSLLRRLVERVADAGTYGWSPSSPARSGARRGAPGAFRPDVLLDAAPVVVGSAGCVFPLPARRPVLAAVAYTPAATAWRASPVPAPRQTDTGDAARPAHRRFDDAGGG